MSKLNPYESYLGGRDAVVTLAESAGRLEELLRSLPAGAANRSPRPGKWSALEILCHLADSELVYAFRLRQALAQEHHVIQPFDQETWARRYSDYDARSALDVFRAVRDWNLVLIRGATKADMAHELTHPERGTMAFRILVETMGGHDMNHIGQIQAIVAASGARRQ